MVSTSLLHSIHFTYVHVREGRVDFLYSLLGNLENLIVLFVNFVLRCLCALDRLAHSYEAPECSNHIIINDLGILGVVVDEDERVRVILTSQLELLHLVVSRSNRARVYYLCDLDIMLVILRIGRDKLFHAVLRLREVLL